MASKGMARWKDNLNRALFKSDNLPEFGGDEKLQRQYEECEAISSGLSTISKAIQQNQVYNKISSDTVDIDRKYQKYPNFKIAQSLWAAAGNLSTGPNSADGSVPNGSTSSGHQAPASPVVEVRHVEDATHGLHPLSLVFQGMAKELENMAKQQFSVENEVNASILTETKQFCQQYDTMSTALKTLQKHCVDVSTAEKNLEDARNKLSRIDISNENAPQMQAKQQVKVEAAQQAYNQSCEKVTGERGCLKAAVDGFVKQEVDMITLMIKYVQFYENYYKMCSQMLTRVLPELEKCRDRAALSAPFEVTLEEHLKQTNREIALPIELTCSWLYLNNAFADHGIFRVGGNVKTVRQLQEKIDRFQAVEEDFTESPTMTTLLKSYLRTMDASLFTQVGLTQLKDTYKNLTERGASESEFVTKYTEIIRKLPKANYDNLKYIFTVLHGVLMNETVNKMSADNIGTCIGPSFDNTKQDVDASNLGAITVSHQSNAIVATLVKHAVTVFDLRDSPVKFRTIKDILENPPVPAFKSGGGNHSSYPTSISHQLSVKGISAGVGLDNVGFSPSPALSKREMAAARPMSVLHVSSTTAGASPIAAAKHQHLAQPTGRGTHKRSLSSDKILASSSSSSPSSSSNPPLPPKPLPPEITHKKRAPKVPGGGSGNVNSYNANSSKSDISLGGDSGQGSEVNSFSNLSTTPSKSQENLSEEDTLSGSNGSSTFNTENTPKQYAFSSHGKPKPAPRTLKSHGSTRASGPEQAPTRPTVAPPPPPPLGVAHPTSSHQSSPEGGVGGGGLEESGEGTGTASFGRSHSPRYGGGNPMGHTESTHL